MAYLYENLGPERFQHLCQALLVRDYPDLQCFPVGQPDGGRDALSRMPEEAVGAVVGQVKFKRQDDEQENAEWMTSALEFELPKIKRLIARGATKYIMITNARGTAHEDSGRIDKVQKWLDDNVPIPAFCLWRDDLDRRLDGADATLKLAFPSILTGDDTLTLIVKAQMGPHQERISRTLRAFVAEQYRKDEEVKFRQVDLANSLLALFVDVPANVSSLLWGSAGRRLSPGAQTSLSRLSTLTHRRFPTFQGDDLVFDGPGYTAGTADLLLDPEIQRGLPWIVLQGAPGQGKSTLAQYVCQVHRARYLDKKDFIAQVPEPHVAASFRLPLKVDLRDLANYLDGRSYLGQDQSASGPVRTFERFLASLVSIQSGGLDYSPDDFAETAAGVPLLLFLDGLDEVAELDLRRTLVDKVVEGLNRLKENHADLQVVVTSRPSLFGRAASFSSSFTELNLAPIGNETIRSYARKWVVARRLDEDRAEEVQGILAQKLEQTHIRELTKNPMQLTILLSLILSIGYSLPDVRTDLYREYVKLFMTREAEKSPVVRAHQALLLEIVEFLAWTLQSGAEADRTSGSISSDDIKKVIAAYLDKGNHGTAILEDLFTGGLERVYVLVQRVEGLFEFEVQPLREYFAAKYLYSSAPVSTFRHQVVQGDRAQRFEAIAANPYWANVTRFYAGFYEGGEIGALSTSLRELAASKDMALGINARSVGAALLTDWVFKSKKFVQDEVIDLVFDPLGVHLATLSALPGFEGESLDEQCGRDTLAKVIFEGHITGPATTRSTCLLLRQNGGNGLFAEFVDWVRNSSGAERGRRFEIAIVSGGLETAQGGVLEELVFADAPTPVQEAARMRAIIVFEPGLLDCSERLSNAALKSVLSWGGFETAGLSNSVSRLASLLCCRPFFRPLDSGTDSSEAEALPSPYLADLDETVKRIEAMQPISSDSGTSDDWAKWIDVIEALRTAYGETWATYRLTSFNVGLIKAGAGTGADVDVMDRSAPLFARALAARASRRSPAQWVGRLAITDPLERVFWLGMLLAWAPSKHVSNQIERISELVKDLSEEDLSRLQSLLRDADYARRYRGGRLRDGVKLPAYADARLGHLLLLAFGQSEWVFLPRDLYADPELERLRQREATSEKMRQFPGWENLTSRQTNQWLGTFADAQRYGAQVAQEIRASLYNHRSMRPSTAAKILGSATQYPRELVNWAYAATRVSYEARHVRDVASEEKWSFG